ncbi:MAG TPA: hypothetical protein VG077_19490 [Verrucomicrobiae bacterium]|nr:hypothetical protein [Verrucomicrobiae bacterium]
MKISADLFEAFLKCPTKCWFRATGETGSGNAYAEWVKSQTASYQAIEAERLVSGLPIDEFVVSPPVESLKLGHWRMALDVEAMASSPAGADSIRQPGQIPGEMPAKSTPESRQTFHISELRWSSMEQQ